jgi:MOSC domain
MSTTITHKTAAELQAGLETIRQSPRDCGVLHLIVRRPEVGVREVQERGELDVHEGLVGDSWRRRTSRRTADGSPHPDMQINIMNSRVVDLVAQHRERWPLAGDQLFIDMDLTDANLPAGTRLQIGTAVLEVTAEPHTGCAKFVERFGVDAAAFVNSPVGRELHLRGINAKVVQAGTITAGDTVTKIERRER